MPLLRRHTILTLRRLRCCHTPPFATATLIISRCFDYYAAYYFSRYDIIFAAAMLLATRVTRLPICHAMLMPMPLLRYFAFAADAATPL